MLHQPPSRWCFINLFPGERSQDACASTYHFGRAVLKLSLSVVVRRPQWGLVLFVLSRTTIPVSAFSFSFRFPIRPVAASLHALNVHSLIFLFIIHVYSFQTVIKCRNFGGIRMLRAIVMLRNSGLLFFWGPLGSINTPHRHFDSSLPIDRKKIIGGITDTMIVSSPRRIKKIIITYRWTGGA